MQYKISIMVIILIFVSVECMDENKKKELSIKLHHALRDKAPLNEVEQLLKEGADPNKLYCFYDNLNSPIVHLGYFQRTQRMYHSNTLHAALYYKKSLEYSSLLCKYGVDVNQQNWCKETPCHVAINKFDTPGMPDIVRFLLRRGADLSLQDDEGNTVFHIVAKNNNLSACSLLITVPEQEHKGIITFVMINKRNKGTKAWCPKPILYKICELAYPGCAAGTKCYGYRY